MSVVRVLVVDDQSIVRRGLRMILDAEDDIEVVAEAADGLAALDSARRTRPDVVLMDIRMPRLDGVETTRRLLEPRGTATRPRVLVLTTFDHDEYIFGALRAGASGYLLKDADPEDIVAAVRTIAAGDALVAPALTRRIIDAATSATAGGSAVRRREALLDRLTQREAEILRLLADGCSNSDLAGRLHLSEPTIKTHVSHLLAKLRVTSRVQAVVLAYETGIVVPGRGAVEPLLEGQDRS